MNKNELDDYLVRGWESGENLFYDGGIYLSQCEHIFKTGKYVSFEEQINKYKDSYYEALKQSSMNWHENGNDYSPFIEDFLSTLYVCYRELDKRFAVVNEGKISKTGRIEATVLNSLAPISKKDICEILPDVSLTTIEAVLGKMVKNGQTVKIGSARNTKYLRNK